MWRSDGGWRNRWRACARGAIHRRGSGVAAWRRGGRVMAGGGARRTTRRRSVRGEPCVDSTTTPRRCAQRPDPACLCSTPPLPLSPGLALIARSASDNHHPLGPFLGLPARRNIRARERQPATLHPRTTPKARERFEDRSARRAIAHSARRATAAVGKRAGAGKRTFVGMGKKGAARIAGARSVPPRRLARDTLRPSASSDQRRTRRSDCGIAQPPTHAHDGTATGSPDQRVRDDGIALATRARTQNSRVRRCRSHRRRRPSAVAVLATGSVRARRRRRRRTSEIGHAAP